jgi:hypothetical protein
LNKYEKNHFLEIFILRLFVEELKQLHPDFPNVSINDRERVKEVIEKKNNFIDISFIK